MNKLKEKREQKGFTQSLLSQQSGVSIRLIQAYEQNYKDIRKAQVGTVLKLAAALDCDIKEII